MSKDPLDLTHVLFLDFDGVLHPPHEAYEHPFCYMDNFCAVVREVGPEGTLPIVISSSWRILHTVEHLRSHFPADIAARIVGVTPFLLPENPELKGSRQREIVSWMDQHAPDGAWLALDDTALYFEDECPHLFLIVNHFPEVQPSPQTPFSLMDVIEERERLMALWHSRGLGIHGPVAQKLRTRLRHFLGRPSTDV
jgi:hypothetical protein